ncbi:MAG: hypothetical protein FJX80_15320 [Bacteroidetes bacterium]|nr:hypothetical protein [Bacteroidota bacterium]
MSSYSDFPEKPILAKPSENSNWGLTIFSIILFIGFFLFFFDREFEFITHLVIVLIVHEFGHFIAMKRFRYKSVKMLFIPMMGAFVQGYKDKYSQRESLIVVLSGPIPGVLIGTMFFFTANYYQSSSLLNLSLLFLFLNTVNLLPLDPLDGGQLVKLLAKKRRDLFLLVFAFTSSVVLIITGFVIKQWILMIFGFLMGVRVRNVQRSMIQRKELEEQKINFETTYNDLTNAEYAALRNYVLENNHFLRKYVAYSDTVDETLIASYVQSLLVAPIQYDVRLFGKFVVISVWFLTVIFLPFLILVLVKKGIISIDWYYTPSQF